MALVTGTLQTEADVLPLADLHASGFDRRVRVSGNAGAVGEDDLERLTQDDGVAPDDQVPVDAADREGAGTYEALAGRDRLLLRDERERYRARRIGSQRRSQKRALLMGDCSTSAYRS